MGMKKFLSDKENMPNENNTKKSLSLAKEFTVVHCSLFCWIVTAVHCFTLVYCSINV